MDKCKKCKNKIDPTEIYGDWFYCKACKKEYTYQPERSKREDFERRYGALNTMET